MNTLQVTNKNSSDSLNKAEIAVINQCKNFYNAELYEWEGLHFRSKAEVKIAESLKRFGITFIPNAITATNQSHDSGFTKKIEADFLIFCEGKIFVLEIDGRQHQDAVYKEKDKEKEAYWRKNMSVERIFRENASDCYNRPDSVIHGVISSIKFLSRKYEHGKNSAYILWMVMLCDYAAREYTEGKESFREYFQKVLHRSMNGYYGIPVSFDGDLFTSLHSEREDGDAIMGETEHFDSFIPLVGKYVHFYNFMLDVPETDFAPLAQSWRSFVSERLQDDTWLRRLELITMDMKIADHNSFWHCVHYVHCLSTQESAFAPPLNLENNTPLYPFNGSEINPTILRSLPLKPIYLQMLKNINDVTTITWLANAARLTEIGQNHITISHKPESSEGGEKFNQSIRVAQRTGRRCARLGGGRDGQ